MGSWRWQWAPFVLAAAAAAILTACVDSRIPTTLEGPFDPVTAALGDGLFRGNAVDLPEDDPRVRRKEKGFEPEQISISLSTTHDSVWISWITGKLKFSILFPFYRMGNLFSRNYELALLSMDASAFLSSFVGYEVNFCFFRDKPHIAITGSSKQDRWGTTRLLESALETSLNQPTEPTEGISPPARWHITSAPAGAGRGGG